MLSAYFSVFVFLGIALLIGVVALLLGLLLGPRRPDVAKTSAYECGFDALGDARQPFSIRFYLIAILFLIFDLETAFLFPWAVVLRQLGHAALWAMLLFLGLLIVGFIYEWKKGALEWE